MGPLRTANAVVLTIDNNGLMAFGDGTPISMLTLSGFGIIDSEGFIVHGLGNTAVIPANGFLTVGFGQTATVLTVPGRMPMATVDPIAPANSYSVSPTNSPLIVPIGNSQLQAFTPDFGSFVVFNENQATPDFMANPVFARLANNNADCGYRYI